MSKNDEWGLAEANRNAEMAAAGFDHVADTSILTTSNRLLRKVCSCLEKSDNHKKLIASVEAIFKKDFSSNIKMTFISVMKYMVN